MTQTTKARIRDHMIGAAVSTIATVALAFATGVWNSKESVSAHTNDMQAVNGKLERVLDLLCEGKPSARACTAQINSAAGSIATR